MRLAYANGTYELTGRIGVGLGGGVSIDPAAEPSPHTEVCPTGTILRTAFSAYGGIGLGPLSRGGSITTATENVLNPAPKSGPMDWGNRGYTTKSGWGMAADGSKPSPKFGVRLGFSIGAEAGAWW